MTQSDILKLLKKSKKWMTSKEIAKKLKITSANESLRKLFKYGEILRKEIPAKFGGVSYLYKTK